MSGPMVLSFQLFLEIWHGSVMWISKSRYLTEQYLIAHCYGRLLTWTFCNLRGGVYACWGISLYLAEKIPVSPSEPVELKDVVKVCTMCWIRSLKWLLLKLGCGLVCIANSSHLIRWLFSVFCLCKKWAHLANRLSKLCLFGCVSRYVCPWLT